MLLPSIKGFIFDLDGTLIDSMKAWEDAPLIFLKSLNIKYFPENIKEEIAVLSLEEAASYFIENFHLKLMPSEILDGIYNCVLNSLDMNNLLMPHALDFLNRHRHLKMCVATASFKKMAVIILQELNIFDYFEFIITEEEVLKSKKDPLIYYKALEKLNLKKEEVVVFEDSLHAINCARQNGFRVVPINKSQTFENLYF